MIDRDRQRGALIGLAIGDALGAAVEFQRPGTFVEVTGFRNGGLHRLAAGEWTDDTSMALALADSIAETGWNLNDQAQRYVAWWRTGAYSVNGRAFDIGITTSASLRRFLETGDASTSGSSALRRAATGRSCAYFAVVLAGLMQGLPREQVLDPLWPVLHRLHDLLPLHPEIEAVARGSLRQRAVNLGDDADTTGAVCGQLAGACWGEAAIPAEWRDGLAGRELLEKALKGLLH